MSAGVRRPIGRAPGGWARPRSRRRSAIRSATGRARRSASSSGESRRSTSSARRASAVGGAGLGLDGVLHLADEAGAGGGAASGRVDGGGGGRAGGDLLGDVAGDQDGAAGGAADALKGFGAGGDRLGLGFWIGLGDFPGEGGAQVDQEGEDAAVLGVFSGVLRRGGRERIGWGRGGCCGGAGAWNGRGTYGGWESRDFGGGAGGRLVVLRW